MYTCTYPQVNLMFANAKTYNQTDSDIYKDAHVMEDALAARLPEIAGLLSPCC